MSALTKLFVVLLVVCSLLLSASVVVFVNRVDNYVTAAKTGATNIASARAQATSLTNRVQELDAALRNVETMRQAQESQLTTQINAAVKDKLDALAQKAEAEKNLQVAQATSQGATALASASQAEAVGLQKMADDLRTKADETLKANSELNTALTVANNEGRALKKELEFQQERNAEMAQQMKTGGTGKTSDATPTSTAPIAGKVTSVDIIGGKKYATISVGSSDNVQKGMKFNVINRTSGEFLGFLTVDRVEANEAIGPVDGTKIDKIQKDVDVRTQL